MTVPLIALLLAAPAQPGAVFLSSGACELCHTRIPQPGGDWYEARQWIGPFELWRSSMMAHASADPYWSAKVRSEVDQSPALQAEIEDTCLRCHAPAEQFPLRAAGERLALAGVGSLGRDGVTCTVCHQIQPAGLGRPESFNAGFRIGADRLLFGPHANPFAMPMLHHTGYEPRESAHIQDSALCGACHTVITTPPGAAVAFLEQAPFLEWLASDYPRQGRPCRSCHMPDSGPQYIAHRPPGGPFPPARPRVPFARHEFAGGNVAIPLWLAESAASDLAELLRRASARARKQLEASLRLELAVHRDAAGVQAQVDVFNLTGHKLPTGFPSRRLWLHVTAIDAGGRTVFESGDWDDAGRLRAGEQFQPPRPEIRAAGEVQIFETELVDTRARSTHSIVRAAGHRKDNRILPAGFALDRLQALDLGEWGVQVVGNGPLPAPGRARTVYRIPRGAVRLRVEAVFQSIKPAWRPQGFVLAGPLAQPVVLARAESPL